LIDARTHLQGLVGQEIRTLSRNQPNRVLSLKGDDVIVGTTKSPDGAPVPIKWVQDGIDVLVRDGELVIDVETLGHRRSSFVGAVLATLPGAVVRSTTPRRIELSETRRMDERLTEVRKFVHDHLNAAMIMVRLDHPLDPEMPITAALEYLDRNEFDLALLRTPEVRIIYRDRLQCVPEPACSKPVKANSYSPRADRLIEHTLEVGEVAKRVREDDVPLLVVGREGPEYIVTRSDFTRPAGHAGVLAVLAALDAQLDELLRPYDAEAWELLEEEKQAEIERFVQRAQARSEEVHRLGYLTLGKRFELVRELDLVSRLGIELGSQADQELATAVRNDIAHAKQERSGTDVLEALDIAETMLDVIDAVLRREQHSDNDDLTRRNDPRSVRATGVLRSVPVVPASSEGDQGSLPGLSGNGTAAHSAPESEGCCPRNSGYRGARGPRRDCRRLVRAWGGRNDPPARDGKSTATCPHAGPR
jgi:hypothetical protein